jgi:hypothetical protein
MKRPLRIIFSAFDPFDDRLLLIDDLPYDPRKCAAGYYRKYVSRMVDCAKHVWGDVLENREPRITVTTDARFRVTPTSP